jgi:alpha-L-arabinofuranosidase
MEEDVLLDVSLLGFEGYKAIAFESMDGYDVLEENTFDKEVVKMHANPVPATDGKNTEINLKALSFNVIRFKK